MELFDILDENNRVVDVDSRENVHSKGLKHPAVMILLMNESKDILIQRRAYTKDSNPGKWDVSCAGHLSSGETYMQAAIRELQEELGLSIKEEDFNYIGDIDIYYEDSFHHKTFIENEHDQVYIVHINKNPQLLLQKEEVEEVKWISMHEFIQLIDSDESCIPNELKNLLKAIV